MTVQSVLRIGNPVLRQIAKPVEAFDTPELHELIRDMLDTMNHYNGAGLAAPQIGISLRVVIFGFEHNTRYPNAEPVPKTVLINPQIIALDECRQDDWEGCLSIPGMRGAVSRYNHIHYKGYDQYGQAIQRDAEQFHARVVQHECDHLDGKLYVDQLTSTQQFGFIEELTINSASQIQSKPD